MTDTPAETEVPETAVTEPEAQHGAPVTWSRGQEVVHPSRDQYLDVVGAFKDDGLVMCADLCGVDYLERPSRDLPEGVKGERFEVVVNLLAFDPPRRVRVRVQVPEDDPTLPTLFQLYPGSEAMEREAYDMFGVIFAGHPDLTRILLPEDWEGHPLRKDYGIGRVPVQFKAAVPTR
jgi:NADH-quinone oxidoreductase subunit C